MKFGTMVDVSLNYEEARKFALKVEIFIDFIIRHLQKNRAIGSKVEDYSLLSTAKPHFN